MAYDDDLQELSSGNSYTHDLMVTQNDRLKKLIVEQRISNELARNEIDQSKSLETTIKSLDDKNGKLQRSVVWLTVVAAILALIQAVASVIAVMPK